MPYLTWTAEDPGATSLTFDGHTVPVIRMNDPEGIDLTPTGHHRARAAHPRGVVLHWPGNTVATARRAARMFKSSKAAVSTHFCVDQLGIMQTLPLERVAYHAGGANGLSIGIDICQPQTDLKRAEEWKFLPWGPLGHNPNDVAKTDAKHRADAGAPPRGRVWKPERLRYGKLEYLPLDPRVVANVVVLLRALEADGMTIELRPWEQWAQPRYELAEWLRKGSTVVNHGDLPGTKIDALPWFKSIRDRYYRGEV